MPTTVPTTVPFFATQTATNQQDDKKDGGGRSNSHKKYKEVKEVAQGKTNPKTNGSLRSASQSYDDDQRQAGTLEPLLTVAEALRDVSRMDNEELVSRLSDGEFHPNALKNYEHAEELVDKCRDAIDEMSKILFHDRPTLADIMGLAMGMLRKDDGYTAPKGWLHAMKILRSSDGELRGCK